MKMAMLLLRAASVAALLQGVAHGALVLTAAPTHGAEEHLVVRTMKAHAFNFTGSYRSYWDLYFGYALLAAGACIVEGILLWLLANIKGESLPVAQAIIVVFIVANISHATVSARYFFVTPIVADYIISIILLTALIFSRLQRA